MCDWEPVDVLDVNFVVARKRHVCTECNSIIKSGDKYLNVSWLRDGEWHKNKACMDCNIIANWIADSDDCGPAFGELHEYLRDSDICYRTRGTKEIVIDSAYSTLLYVDDDGIVRPTPKLKQEYEAKH